MNLEDRNNGDKLLISLGILLLVLGFFAGLTYISETSKRNGKHKNTQIYNLEKITIGQRQLKEIYEWKDVILWIESKENFEKAYGDSLKETGHAMLFMKDPMCTGPFGETGDWECEKMCFRYVVPEENPNVINEIAEKSKGKTLVIIGSLFNNGTEFGGSAYWCE